MIALNFGKRKKSNLKILCLGAHSDDIEIGCGGTILRLLSEHNDTDVQWVVFGSGGKRNREALVSANKFLRNAKRKNIIIKDFRDGYFPFRGEEIKNYFEELKLVISPDIIFSHNGNDLHQDHSLISKLTWNTFREHLILEYEIIKYDGDIGTPNFYVRLDEAVCNNKVKYIVESFESQRNRDWFTPDTFMSMLRIRGVESRSRSKYAEGFYCRKMFY